MRIALLSSRRYAASALLAGLVGLLAAGCGAPSAAAPASVSAGPIKIVGDNHVTLTFKHPAHRLIVIEPSNFEIVDVLGLRSDIVGVDASVPTYTPAPWSHAAHGLPTVGSAIPAVSPERIAARRPDLVIASAGVSGLSGLKALGIPVLILEPSTIAGVYHDIVLVGEATGRTSRATRLVAALKRQVRALEARVRTTRSRPAVFYDLGGLYTGGRGSFISSLIKLAGGRDVADSMSTEEWPQVTAEQVVAANPDYILVDPSGGTAAAERQIPGFSATTAGKQHHILAVPDSSYLDQPSVGLVRGLQELIAILHPKI
jgi:iron complex transport system substrate-binding protein